jgi:hypothetical protein
MKLIENHHQQKNQIPILSILSLQDFLGEAGRLIKNINMGFSMI